MEPKKWKEKKKLGILKEDILKIENDIEKITIEEKWMGHITDMEKYKKLINRILPLRIKLEEKTKKKIIKIMKSWDFSKNVMIEYLTELYFILESEHSLKIYTITLGGGKIPRWGDIPIYQIPPEELRRWVKRNELDAL